MRSTLPFDDSTSFYDYESDEDSITSTIDSSVLDANYSEEFKEGNAKVRRYSCLPFIFIYI